MSPENASATALNGNSAARASAGHGPEISASAAWPLFVALLLYCAIVAGLLVVSLRRNGGHFAYALDDPYIHMAIAKNFSQHGVWGVTRYGFSSANSSILWPLLLSGVDFIFGIHIAAPLVLNILFSSLFLASAFWVLGYYRVPALFTFVALTLSIFLIPLPTLTFEGLEHTLQTFLTLLITFLAARYLSRESPATAQRDARLLLALAPLLVATRFEGMFAVFGITAMLLLRPAPEFRCRVRFAFTFAILGFLPVAVFGAISRLHGWEWLPNTLLLKGRIPHHLTPGTVIEALFSAFQETPVYAPHLWDLAFLVLLLYVLAFREPTGAWESRQVMSTIFIMAALLHVEFAQTGWFFRYEAYLMGTGFIIVAAQIRDYLPNRITVGWLKTKRLPQYAAVGVLIWLTSVPSGVRAYWAFVLTPQATSNIYQQQVQMGQFVRKYYQGSVVALNDIGAVNYYADIHCQDLWGLADLNVLHKRRHDAYHIEDVAEAARTSGSRIAIVYDDWFRRGAGGLPQEWALVGSWTIKGNIIAGSDTVTFYAVDPSEAPKLVEHLRDFSSSLPPDVVQTGAYTKIAGPQ